MTASVVVLESPNSPCGDGAGFARVASTDLGHAKRQQLNATLTLLSMSAWSYALIVGANALS
jgi:hypothetical protein